MSTQITVHGFRKDGPIYSVTTAQTGWRGRRRGAKTVNVGKVGGRYSSKPLSRVVTVAGTQVLLLNKGHEYDVLLDIDGTEHLAILDARQDHEKFKLGSGVTLISVALHESSDTEPTDETS